MLQKDDYPRLDSLRLNDLLELMCKGDKDAFAEILETVRGPTLQYLCCLTRNYNDAEDLLQETSLKLFFALQQSKFYPDSVASLRAYCRRIARNAATDYFRAKKRRKHHVTESHESDVPEPYKKLTRAYLDAQLKIKLKDELAGLPKAERHIFLQRMKGFTNKEIADMYGVTGSRIGQRIRETLALIRNALFS